MARAWRTTRAPILMRRVHRLVSDQNEYGLLAFAATLTIAGRDIVTRKIAAEVPSLIVTLASAIFVGLTGAVVSVVFGSWTQPDTTDLVMIAAAACALFGAYHYSVVAIRLGEISLTAPFRYSVILWGLDCWLSGPGRCSGHHVAGRNGADYAGRPLCVSPRALGPPACLGLIIALISASIAAAIFPAVVGALYSGDAGARRF